ncbi:unnamed protein product [Prunus armeniaca]|uniref:HAT C-terminal dimerisation domain-containing protein n=1 Tax=Prunus armeniaca TaxID=36596 RepID=A0A6J5TEY6_PRUAR|nr:unnamed protein product [Prunus armeniaca]
MAGDTKGNEEVVLEDDQQSDLRTLAELLCFEEVPPKWTQDFDSLHSIGKFSPLFMPSFNEVETECMEVFEKKKMETKKILGNFDGQISLSVDILRCESYFDPSCCGDYLCLSAHFIDENWELKKWVLQFSCISVSVSGPSDDSLHKYEDWGILRTLEDWGIENKISALTLKNDNCNNELVEFVKRRIQENNGKLLRVYCCAEMISVMVQDAFDKIEDIAHKVRQVYNFNIDYPFWFLKLAYLQIAVKSWSTKDVLGSNDVVPSPEEWKKVEGVCKILENINEVSDTLFYTTHLTPNVYLCHLHWLPKILAKVSIDSDSFNRIVVDDMSKKFDKYWEDMFLLLAISAALDPRLKMRYIEFLFSKVKDRNGNSQVAVVLGAIHKLFDEYVVRFPLQDYQQFIHLNDHSKEKSDLDCYLEQPVLRNGKNFNALAWWRIAGIEYPTLSRMARDFLAIPVSLASKIDAYYTVPKPADDHLVWLKPDLMNALMCTRSWV